MHIGSIASEVILSGNKPKGPIRQGRRRRRRKPFNNALNKSYYIESKVKYIK
jgi:hypothetical protein